MKREVRRALKRKRREERKNGKRKLAKDTGIKKEEAR